MPAAEHTVRLPDRYRVTRRIARGGMATVYACEDQVLGRLVAVKVLAPHYAADEDAVARFQREARAAARVSDHPHVATIYDIGDHEDQAFIVMEYLPGGTIADKLKAGEPIPRPTAVRWLEEAASALDHAHGEGIVHRDVKPANLLLDANGRLAVADFGIARMASDVHVTSTGVVLGTAAYLSPEQAMGESATAASDRYALAAVAFELLCGRKPFEVEHAAAQARAHVETPPPLASEITDLPQSVDAVLCRGLDKEPDRRWPTSLAMVAALDEALGDEAEPAVAVPPTDVTQRIERTPPPPAPPPAPPRRTSARPAAAAPSPAPRRRWAPVLVAAILVGLLVGGAIAAIQSAGTDEPNTATSGNDQEQRTTTSDEPQQTQAQEEETPAAQETTPAEPETPAAEQPSGNDPRQLQAQGHTLLTQGNYDEAIPVLQKAADGCPVTRTDPCAYALFDLGVALRKAGRPDEAIPVLEQRLQNPDQKGTVQAELKRAQKDAQKGAKD